MPSRTLLLPVFCLAAVLALAEEHQHQPAMSHGDQSTADQQHKNDVERHGDVAMGFSHLKTTHHFLLTAAGGVISVDAKIPTDTATLNQIREHLLHITKAFKQGDFSDPELTHSRVPPGVDVMQRSKSELDYRYVRTKLGAKVVLATKNADVLKAVHEFLRFQINDHGTGDPLNLQAE